MIADDIRAAIAKRISTESEWDYGMQQCWKEETAILLKDINETVDFIANDCTDEELSWLSEVFEDIAEASKESRRIIDAAEKRAASFENDKEKQNIRFEIDLARYILDNE